MPAQWSLTALSQITALEKRSFRVGPREKIPPKSISTPEKILFLPSTTWYLWLPPHPTPTPFQPSRKTMGWINPEVLSVVLLQMNAITACVSKSECPTTTNLLHGCRISESFRFLSKWHRLLRSLWWWLNSSCRRFHKNTSWCRLLWLQQVILY